MGLRPRCIGLGSERLQRCVGTLVNVKLCTVGEAETSVAGPIAVIIMKLWLATVSQLASRK